MYAIEIHKLEKTFSRKQKNSWKFWGRTPSDAPSSFQALAPLDLQIKKGEAVAFIGPNGAGKSTTIKILTGILYPTAGEAKVLGLTPWRDRQRLAHSIGAVFGQRSQLWLHLPPRDTLKLLGHIYSLEKNKLNARIAELSSLFEIEELLDVPTRKLSLGQRMRCEIAASLLHRPSVLFLDEPTIGLDPVAKAHVRDLVRRANREEGVTVFLTSHDAGDIEKLAKRVLTINHGRLVFDGSTTQLKQKYLRTKEVSVRLLSPFVSPQTSVAYEVIKLSDKGVRLSVPADEGNLQQFLADLLRENSIEDLTIAPPPLEDIIATMYRSGPT